MRFSHLHLHSDYSFLDGVGKSVEYADLAARAGHAALAITDHGNLHGLPSHRRACEKYDLKPVYGVEMYVNDTRDQTAEIKTRAREEKLNKAMLDPTFSDAHLVLLAQSAVGWKNLLAINHDAVRNGYYYKPRTTHDFVCQHAEGLIATTTCLGSLFNRLALAGDDKRLGALLRKFKDAFSDRFFREVHVNEMPEQVRANARLKIHCDKLGIKPVLSCDVHYACAGDVDRQDEMIAASRRKLVSDPDSFKLTTRNLWFMDPRTAWEAAKKWGYGFDRIEFADMVLNAAEVADSCAADIYPDPTLKPPAYLDDNGQPVPDSFEYLKQLAIAGFKAREHLFPDRTKYAEQLKRELRVVRNLGLADFFLVTWDVVRFCTSYGISCHTRGSGAASLLAALTGITQIDPLAFGLSFERFMDPDRPNAPDFDLDINSARRHEAIAFLVKKYGGPDGTRIARVCSISTYGLKSALRDVLVARGHDLGTAMKLADVTDAMEPAVGHPIPKAEQVLAGSDVQGRDAAVQAAIAELHDKAPQFLKDFLDANKPVIKGAVEMVGRVRGRSLHAAGFVIGPGDLVDHIPIDRAINDGEKVITTAWTEGQHATDISPTGLLKLDMLGLETVAVVDEAKRSVSLRDPDAAAVLDLWTMDYEDPATLAEFRSGDGTGIHQFNETNGALAKFVREARPRNVHDIAAAIAAFRPGSMEHLDDYVARAQGREPIPKVHAIYDDIVAETKGILIYQEQIMQILNRFAGIPLRDAYSCIKAISKKKEKDIFAYRDRFMAGASGTIGVTLADRIWKDVMAFAGYGFNKAHAASYAALAWQTAYLRAHHPADFWRAWLSRVPNETSGRGRNKTRKVETYMRRARSRGIRLVAPVVGYSDSTWKILKDGRLLAPLSLIIGIGEEAADEVCRAYNRDGPWLDLYGFLAWAEDHARVVTSKGIASLARSGAFRKWCSVAEAVDAANVYAEVKKTKAAGTKADQTKHAIVSQSQHYRVTLDDDEIETGFERQAFGFAFWRDAWEVKGRRAFVRKLISDGRLPPDNGRGDRVRGKRRAFCIRSVRLHRDRKGNQMAFLDLETVEGRSVKGVVFASVHKTCSVQEDRVYLLRGEFERDGSFLVGGTDPAVSLDEVMDRERGRVAM